MFKEILLDENIELYRDYYDRATFKTIYHHPQFLLAEERAEDYNTYLYIYEENEQYVILPSIKRRVNDIDVFANENEEYFDLVTPHEYSGVIANKFDSELIRAFFIELITYCKENSIIFGFIRFNPYRNEYKEAVNYYVMKSADQVWLDCSKDVIQDGFSKSRKRDLKNAMRLGLIGKKVEKNSNNKKVFIDLYKKSMDRLQAKKFFYFSEEYFESIFDMEFSDLFFAYDSSMENILAAAIILKDSFNKTVYYHLSCRKTDIVIPGVMELLISTFSVAMQQESYKIVHLGGGATESLRKFKEKFSNKRVPYYIAYNIFDNDKYRYLCSKYCEQNPECAESKFLPLYRSKE